MSAARDEVFKYMQYDNEFWVGNGDPNEPLIETLNAYAAEVRAATLREASDAIQEARNGFLNDDVSFGMAVARTVLSRMAGESE